jgi:hypothetical protein
VTPNVKPALNHPQNARPVTKVQSSIRALILVQKLFATNHVVLAPDRCLITVLLVRLDSYSIHQHKHAAEVIQMLLLKHAHSVIKIKVI